MRTKEEIQEEIDDKRKELEEKEKDLKNFELDPDDYESQYVDALNEEGPVRIGSLEYDPAYVLENVDPTAYRCGLNDYVDSLELSDDPSYKNIEEEIETLQEEIEMLEAELEEIEA
jgi:hypothetical protein